MKHNSFELPATLAQKLSLILVGLALLIPAEEGTAQTVSFNSAAHFAAGSNPLSVAVGDFNGDGEDDLAVANQISFNVSVLIGAGNGTFGAATDIPVGRYPSSVAVGDFNGDNHPDLAVANFGDSSVSILLGDGSGGFGAATNLSVGGNAMSVAVGHFNNDNDPDLAVANRFSNSVSILLGTGASTGTFSTATNYAVGLQPIFVAIGQFNNDGYSDLVVANYAGGDISVLLGTGLGAFGQVTNYPAGLQPISVAIGDFSGDGSQDLAVANLNSQKVSLLLGTSAGAFGAATDLSVGQGPNSVTIGDFNNDGEPDLAVANFGSNSVSILIGEGSASFEAATSFPAGVGSVSVATGDFDSDGKPDLAVANHNGDDVSILLNTTVLDGDIDGVPDDEDMCPATVIPEGVPTVSLNTNHWALIDDNFDFDTLKKGKGAGNAASYTITDTGGCSCEQIISALGLGTGHTMHGCSNGEMENWTAVVKGAGKAATDLAQVEAAMPAEFILDSAYPNPFNPQTTIGFALPEASRVALSVYDVMGRRVRLLADGVWPAGSHTAVFEAGALPSGTYLVRLDTPAGRLTRLVQLIK